MTTAELRGANLAIHEHQNDAFDVTFNFVNADGTPFTSLSAYTLTANVWSRSAAIQPITITVLDTHIRQLSLTADQMTALATVPNLTWSLQATMGGRPQTWVAGSFNLYRQGQGVNTTTGNQINVLIGSTQIDVELNTSINTVIGGGNTNDLLVKQSSTDFDVAWQDEISIDQINFDTTAAEELTVAGQMAWDADVDTIDVLLRNGTSTPTLMHIGQDEYFYAKASAAITRGQVVYYTGTDGASGHILAAPFLADGTHPSKTVIGVASQDADIGEFVHVLWRGKLRKINTSLLTPGILYASTTVPGGFQSTAPVAPNNIVTVAVAIDQKNNGTILVRPTFAGSLAESEDVDVSAPSDGDVLTYSSGTVWENVSRSTLAADTAFTGAFTSSFSGTIARIATGTTVVLAADTLTGSGVLGTDLTGKTWSEIGSFTRGAQSAYPATAVSSLTTAVVDVGEPGGIVACSLRKGSSSNRTVGIIVAWVDSNNYIAVRYDRQSGSVHLFITQVVAGTSTTLAAGTATAPWSVAARKTQAWVRVIAGIATDGTDRYITANALDRNPIATIATSFDSTFDTSTSVGIIHTGSDASSDLYRDFIVTRGME